MTPRMNYRIVSASSFCRHHGIKLDRTVKFNTPHVDKDRVLVLDLRATTRIGRHERYIARTGV